MPVQFGFVWFPCGPATWRHHRSFIQTELHRVVSSPTGLEEMWPGLWVNWLQVLSPMSFAESQPCWGKDYCSVSVLQESLMLPSKWLLLFIHAAARFAREANTTNLAANLLNLMHINVFHTRAKSTFKYDTVIQAHLLRDRPHQGIGINGKMFYLCRCGQAGVTEKQQASWIKLCRRLFTFVACG